MSSRINSLALVGYEACLVQVEIDLKKSEKGSLQIIGLPDAAVRESRERVKAALHNIGISLEFQNGVINLAPGDIKKEGALYDLPIAIGILTSLKKENILSDYIILGELALSGELRPVKGALAYALQAKAMGMKGIILPLENVREAEMAEGLIVIGLSHLKQVHDLLLNPLLFVKKSENTEDFPLKTYSGVDFSDIKGQKQVKRAFEIAASGQHHLLLCGPPGIGKTLLSRAFASLLPEMSADERLETLRIHSLANLPVTSHARPFRAPHHSISHAGLIGGSQQLRPGEVSLAHNGVLFLDELPEFKRSVLEVLRQPMEDRQVTISRARGTSTFPCKFLLVATMNPCPCGYLGHPTKRCKDTPKEVDRYQSRISGPLLDRIDMRIEVSPIKAEEFKEKDSETSEMVRERVNKARQAQIQRFSEKGLHIRVNQEMGPKEIDLFCALCEEGEEVLKRAQDILTLTHRSTHKLLKVARTIADLEGKEKIEPGHLLEAMSFREANQT